MALPHLLHLPHEAASSLQLAFVPLRDEDLRQLTLQRRRGVQGQVVLHEGAWRQGLRGPVVLDGDGDGGALPESGPGVRLLQVVGGAVAALVGGRRLQNAPLHSGELGHSDIGVV